MELGFADPESEPILWIDSSESGGGLFKSGAYFIVPAGICSKKTLEFDFKIVNWYKLALTWCQNEIGKI